MHMREEDDRRPDYIIKKEILSGLRVDYDVILAIDDRKQVVDMFREEGVTCLQCADNTF